MEKCEKIEEIPESAVALLIFHHIYVKMIFVLVSLGGHDADQEGYLHGYPCRFGDGKG